jgi:hypothetical protein
MVAARRLNEAEPHRIKEGEIAYFIGIEASHTSIAQVGARNGFPDNWATY